jgi:hypothetical protein
VSEDGYAGYRHTLGAVPDAIDIDTKRTLLVLDVPMHVESRAVERKRRQLVPYRRHPRAGAAHRLAPTLRDEQ